MVPILILAFQRSAQNAVAVSLVAMCGTTVSAAIGYLRQRRVDYKLAILYDVLDVPGVVIGAYLTTFFQSKVLTGLCGFFIMISLCFYLGEAATLIPKRQARPRVQKVEVGGEG